MAKANSMMSADQFGTPLIWKKLVVNIKSKQKDIVNTSQFYRVTIEMMVVFMIFGIWDYGIQQ